VPSNLREGIRLFAALNDPNAGKTHSKLAVDGFIAKVQAGPDSTQVKTLLAEADRVFKQVQEDETIIVCLFDVYSI
jgi:hypothetical protein